LKHKGKRLFKNAILEGSASVTQECTQFSWFSLEKAGAAKLEPLDLLLQQSANGGGRVGVDGEQRSLSAAV